MKFTTPKEIDKITIEKDSEIIHALIEKNLEEGDFTIIGDGTNNKYVDMSIKSEFPKDARNIVSVGYVENGWGRVILKGTSETGEQPGLTGVKLYFN